MRIGILTGGGDTAALNSIIYGASLEAEKLGYELLGFTRGWQGVLSPIDYVKLSSSDINPGVGGTLLRSSRTNPVDAELDAAASNIAKVVDGLIAIGGDDTLSVGKRLQSRFDIPITFISKTIDNDVGQNAPGEESFADFDPKQVMNYFSSGFPTAAKKIVQFTSDLRTTSYSHDRVMFLEAMGRTPGWLALASYAGSPDFILVPEVPLDWDQFKEILAEKYQVNKNVVVVVAEGVRYEGSDNPISQDSHDIDVFGHKKLGGVAEALAGRVKKELGIKNSNYVNPNLLYRSGTPTDIDGVVGINLGKSAVDTLRDGIVGHMSTVHYDGEIFVAESHPVSSVLKSDESGSIIPRTLDQRFYDSISYCITEEGREYFRPIFAKHQEIEERRILPSDAYLG